MDRVPDTTIFIIDDDEGVRGLTSAVLKKAGYDVRAYESVPTALEGLREGSNPSLIVLDGILPGMDGTDFLDRISTDDALPAVRVLLISDMLDLSRIRDRPKVTIAARLDKPFSSDSFMKAVLGALAGI